MLGPLRYQALVLALICATAGCRKSEPGRAEGPQAMATPLDAPMSAVRLEVTLEAPITLSHGDDIERLVATPDGGFLVVDRELDPDVGIVVRKLAADGAEAWRFHLRTRGSIDDTRVRVDDAVATPSAVWLAVQWEGGFTFDGVTLKESWPAGDDLTLIKLDLATGERLTYRNYGAGTKGTVSLATDGEELYGGLLYLTGKGQTQWGPPTRTSDGGYRVVRFSPDADVVWMVDSTAHAGFAADPLGLRTSPCCVVVTGRSSIAVEVGGKTAALPDRFGSQPWLAVLSDDGTVRDVQILSDAEYGLTGIANLDGDRVDYVLWSQWGEGVIGIAHPTDGSNKRLPLGTCNNVPCEAHDVRAVDGRVVALLSSTWDQRLLRLYGRDGVVVAVTAFPVERGAALRSVRAVGDEITYYFSVQSALRPVRVKVVDRSP